MKIKLLCLFLFLYGFLPAQTILTKSANEPSAGENMSCAIYDTIMTIPKNMGQNQVWDFSFMRKSASSFSKMYKLASSVPGIPNVFPNADLSVSESGAPLYFCYNQETDKLEEVGFWGTQTNNYSDPLILMKWPFAYGNSFSDSYSGIAITYTSPGSGVNGSVTGMYTCIASGMGTLILPEGIVLNNVLQVSSSRTFSMDFNTIGWNDYDWKMTEQVYYDGKSKFPVLHVMYQSSGSRIMIDNALALGLGETRAEEPSIYPNPSQGNITVKLPLSMRNKGSISIFTLRGELIRSIPASGEVQTIDISGLSHGMYILEAGSENGRLVKKLVIE